LIAPVRLAYNGEQIEKENSAMNVIEVKGRINQEGKLEVELPEGLSPGEVRVRIERAAAEPLTDAEIERLMQTEPASGAAIVAEGLPGGWREQSIENGQAWVEEQRRRRKAAHAGQAG
jgi:hypothetical protein